MEAISAKLLKDYIEKNIPSFHAARASKLAGLKLKEVLERKNPYLFKAKHLESAGELVKALLDAFLSSQEESLFGTFLEQLAIFICDHVYDGIKAPAEGIDLRFMNGGIVYLVAIKSGPNWGNSDQINKMKDNFRKAKRVLATNHREQVVIAVNGCCYGREMKQQKEEYLKLCGQSFWEFISGMPELYIEIVEPLGHLAKQRNEEFALVYAKILTRFTVEFAAEFCSGDFAIDWAKLVRFNSGSDLRTRTKKNK